MRIPTARPYRGDDGRFHYVYVTYDMDTGCFYVGKRSTLDENDRYQGSGKWIKQMRRNLLTRKRLFTEKVQFYASEQAAFQGEIEWVALALEHPLCMNEKDGGEGSTSAFMTKILADPDVKERHIAGVNRRWMKPAERDAARLRTTLVFTDPSQRQKYLDGHARRWASQEERQKASAGQAKRFSKEDERAAQSERAKARFQKPAEKERASQRKLADWQDPVKRQRYLDGHLKRKVDPEAARERLNAKRRSRHAQKRAKGWKAPPRVGTEDRKTAKSDRDRRYYEKRKASSWAPPKQILTDEQKARKAEWSRQYNLRKKNESPIARPLPPAELAKPEPAGD